MAHNKTISLDEDTAQIADRMPNYSRFVRQSLIRYAATATELASWPKPGEKVRHIAPIEARIWGETKDKCNPMHKNGRCPICWGDE